MARRDRLPGVARMSADVGKIDAFKDHRQLGGGHGHAITVDARETEHAALQPLHPKRKAVAVPIKHLEPVASLVAEDEQMPRERIAAELIANDLRQAVKAAPHIGRRDAEINLNRRRQAQHGPMPARTPSVSTT